jgi:hypothetical protein
MIGQSRILLSNDNTDGYDNYLAVNRTDWIRNLSIKGMRFLLLKEEDKSLMPSQESLQRTSKESLSKSTPNNQKWTTITLLLRKSFSIKHSCE